MRSRLVSATVHPICDLRAGVHLSLRSEGEVAMRPCRYCDRDFQPAVRSQAFCSRRCASLHQHAINPRERRSSARWAPKTEQQRKAYGSAYRRARDHVVAAAIGTACPGCGVLLTAANCQADHVTPHALGGSSSPTNLRALCAQCNHRRGAVLGGRVTVARRAARRRRDA